MNDIEPGPELDKIIAQKIFGWGKGIVHEGEWMAADPHEDRYPAVPYRPPPSYSTDLTEAFTIVSYLNIPFRLQTRSFSLGR